MGMGMKIGMGIGMGIGMDMGIGMGDALQHHKPSGRLLGLMQQQHSLPLAA